jgi:2-keto-4-pentenoate hydratase/2-oxohepta-3-ene-1,7-dioic acid hydratase in catechol pathway
VWARPSPDPFDPFLDYVTARVSEAAAWDHVAGLTVGRDISERNRQLLGPAPQFSLGKSFAGFSPIRPWLVMPDELADP